MAIRASKGAVDAEAEVEDGLAAEEVEEEEEMRVEARSVVEELRRSVAEARRAPPVLEWADWTCEEAYILVSVVCQCWPSLQASLSSKSGSSIMGEEEFTSAPQKVIPSSPARSIR